MLRITPCTNTAHAKTYFTSADYYTEGQELVGLWRGRGAERLGLRGDVDKRRWDALCENLDPNTGGRLTVRQKDFRRVGWDFTFDGPKSLSLLYGLTGDERLRRAFTSAVDATMADIEAEARTRVRRQGSNTDRTTGNLVWGQFTHTLARPVNGVPDPLLHAHNFVLNLTYDGEESRWKAAEIGGIKRDAPYFAASFHARLARNLNALGLATRRTKDAFEIVGLSRDTLAKFSTRTAVIERLATELGISDPERKAGLGATTREKKAKDLSLPELREIWNERLTPEETASVRAASAAIGGPSLPEEPLAAREAVEHAAHHCFERHSVVPERSVLAEAMRYAAGSASCASVHRAFAAAGFIRGELNGRRMATTRDVLGEEQRMIEFARAGRGAMPTLGDPDHRVTDTELSTEQRRVVATILGSRDRVTLLRGAAGTGKSRTMVEAVRAVERGGARVFTFAPSATASRGELRDKGFSDADTVARLLVDERMQESARGSVLWIDEAGLLGSRTMGKLFDLAWRIDARVVLQGDRRQHGAVERGSALKLLETEAGLVPAELRQIRRQRDRYKDVVNDLSQGRVEAAFRGLEGLGWIREVDGEQRYALMAEDYVKALARLPKGEQALIVSPTHREAERITGEVRSRLKRAGLISGEEHRFTVLEREDMTEAQRADPVNYLPGQQVIVFTQNAKGHTRGDRVEVDGGPLPLEQADRFQVYHRRVVALAAGDVIRITANGATADKKHQLHNGSLYTVDGFTAKGDIVLHNGWTVDRRWGHIASGFVVTSYASQGRSVREVLIGQSAESFPASSREQAYVSVSRGKTKATIYTSSKADLLEAIKRSEERTTATEFVSRRRAHLRVLSMPRHAPPPVLTARERELRLERE